MYAELTRNDLDVLFRGSIITYGNSPVLVKNVDEDNNLHLARLTAVGKVLKITSPDDPKFDLKPVKLGMCNTGNGTVFVERLPMRAYKVGVCRETMKISGLKGSMEDYDKITNFRDLTGLKESILNEYPSLEWSMANVGKEGKVALAFSRWFAIDSDFNLYYRANKIGMLNPDNGAPVFYPHKAYLKEVFNNA